MIRPELIQIIVCPSCKSDLRESENKLVCGSCKLEYPIREGIPLLYPPDISTFHLQEEENLSIMMKSAKKSSREQFSALQWNLSKQEFWEMVKNNTSPGLMINIGCGYDFRFKLFEQAGYKVVNFDMVFNMLRELQKDHEANYCIGGDVNKLPFRKATFDYVVSIDLIHHECNNLFGILKAYRDLLKPNGCLFLEDPNAWGMFQIPKSILLPRYLHKQLRKLYHNVKQSVHKPADYEFPTSVWKVKKILAKLGFDDIRIYPNTAYPNISEKYYKVYNILSTFDYIKKHHNFHYMLSAVKK